MSEMMTPPETEDDQVCRQCGCDDFHSCQDFDDDGKPCPCHWVEEDLCSRCARENEGARRDKREMEDLNE